MVAAFLLLTALLTFPLSAVGQTRELTVDLRIGSIEDQVTAFYGNVRVAPMGDGVAVLNSAEPFVRTFDTAGRHVASFGRKGQGPGELMNPTAMGVVGESIWVSDFALRRVVIFDFNGTAQETITIPTEVLTEGLGPVFPTLLSSGMMVGRPVTQSRTVAGTGSPPVPFMLLDQRGHVVDTLDTWDFTGRTVQFESGDLRLYIQRPLPSLPFFAVSPGGKHVATAVPLQSGSVAFRRYSSEGAIRDEWIRRLPTPPIDARVRDSIVDDVARRLSAAASKAPTRRKIENLLQLPHASPPLSGMLVDPKGGVWIRPPLVSPEIWTRADASGARLVLPSDISLQVWLNEVGWGLQEDEWGVKYVVRLR